MDMYDQFTEERDKSTKLQTRLQNLERENKALEVRFTAEAEERVRIKDEECQHELRKLQMRLREAEKRNEVLKVNGDERVNLAIDAKDKEIYKLQEKLNGLKMENDIETSKFEKRINELVNEIKNKDKNHENFKSQAG